MEYKVIDDSGTVLARFDNAAKAAQYFENNSDIAAKIDPMPDDAVLEEHAQTLKALAAERVLKAEAAAEVLKQHAGTLKALAVHDTIGSITHYSPTGLLSAAEAKLAIQRDNERKYDVGLKNLIAAVIEGSGTTTAPELNRYQIKKLTDLGYYVKKVNGGYSVTVDDAPLVPTVTKQQKEEEAEDLFKQMQLTKLHKAKDPSYPNVVLNSSTVKK